MIFILDKKEKVINTLKNNKNATSRKPYFDDLLSQDLSTGTETFSFNTTAYENLSEDLAVGNYVAFKSKDGKYKLFQITEVEIEHENSMQISVYSECAGLSLTNNVFRKRKMNSTTIAKLIDAITENTDWNTGFIDKGINQSLDLEIPDSPCYSVLQTNLPKFGAEVEFRVEINNGRISKKFIDVYKQRGKITGKRFTYSRDIEKIVKRTDSTELYTALIGKGKNDANFRDITIDGIDKPEGQDFVADQKSFERFNRNGYHLMGIYSVDSDSPNEILRKTYEKLQEVKEPKVSYEIPVVLLGELLGLEHDKISIGDQVGILDSDFNPPLMLSARVSKLEISETNNQNTKCILSNFKEISSNITEEMRKAASELKDYVEKKFPISGEDIQSEVINGTHMSKEYVSQISADIVKASLVEAEKIVADEIKAVNGKFEKVETDIIKSNEVISNLGKFDEIIAGKVDAVEGTFVELEAKVGIINTLVSGNITSDNIHSSGISSDKLTIRDGFIKNAMIDTVNASKITAGEINTNKVHIASANGGIVIADNTQQFKDKNGKVRIQMGQDASGNFNFGVYDATGSGTLIDATGVKEKALADGIIKDRMIGQGEIGGNKINISSMIDEVNKESNTKTIKGSKVQLDTEGQTLEVAFNKLKTTVNDTSEKTESNTTSLNAQQGKIDTLIQDTTIEKNGQSLKLKDEYSKLEQTVGGINSTVGEHTSQLETVTTTATEAKNIATNATADIQNITKRVASAETAIQQSKDAIELKASKAEVTEAVNDIEVGGRNFVLNSKFKTGDKWSLHQATYEIIADESLKTNVAKATASQTGEGGLFQRIGDNHNLESGDYTFSVYVKGANGVLVEIALERAISKTITLTETWTRYDITMKANQFSTWNKTIIIYGESSSVFYVGLPKVEKGNKATDWTPAPEDVDSAINSKANASEVYTKAETDSKITVKANEISQSVTNKLNDYATTSSLTQTANSIIAKFTSTGGQNLLKNSDAKNGTAFWSGNGATLTIGQSGGTPFIGGNEFKSTFPHGLKYQETLKLKADTEYVYEGWIYSDVSSESNPLSPLHYWATSVPNQPGHDRITILDYRQEILPRQFNKCYVHFRTHGGDVYFTPYVYGLPEGAVCVARQLSLTEGKTEKAWTPHPSEVYEGSTLIDSNGVTVNNGALRVKDGSGNTMLEGDSNGVLYLRNQLNVGDVGRFNQHGINLQGGSVKVVENVRDMNISNSISFNSNSIVFDQNSTQNGYPPFSTTIKHDPQCGALNIVGGGRGDNALYVNGYAVMLDGHSIYPSNIYTSKLESRDTMYNFIQLRSHNNDMWLRSASEYFTFQCGYGGDNWTQSFAIRGVNYPAEGQNQNWIDFGQMKSNDWNGSYRGVSIRKYENGGAVPGDLVAGRYYLSGTECAHLTNFGDTGLAVYGKYGSFDVGARDYEFCYLSTDRYSFHLCKQTMVSGNVWTPASGDGVWGFEPNRNGHGRVRLAMGSYDGSLRIEGWNPYGTKNIDYVFKTSEFYPTASERLGANSGGYRWGQIYSTVGSISTSDSSVKEDIKRIAENETVRKLAKEPTDQDATGQDMWDYVKHSSVYSYRYRKEVLPKDDKQEEWLGVLADEIPNNIFSKIGEVSKTQEQYEEELKKQEEYKKILLKERSKLPKTLTKEEEKKYDINGNYGNELVEGTNLTRRELQRESERYIEKPVRLLNSSSQIALLQQVLGTALNRIELLEEENQALLDRLQAIEKKLEL